MFDQLCIVGVGLIGGSVARAARAKNLCRNIIGVGRSEASLQRAVELGVIDEWTLSIEEAVRKSDLVILCTPVGSFQSLFELMKPVWRSDAIYTDVGSTKLSVVQAIQAVFGEVPANFVPAHPIAGSENNGVDASTVTLFQNRRVILTPTDTTSEDRLRACVAFWKSMDAEVSVMTVDHHDTVLAATSHLPHVLAFALVEMLRSKDDEQEIFKYAAGGFRDFTRIASSDPTMWADICMANAGQILSLLREFKLSMDVVSDCLDQADRTRLLAFFEDAKAARQQYLNVLN